jgi:hypothetical protein
MTYGVRPRIRYTRFVRPHATYVYTGTRVINVYDTGGELRRKIHGDEFGQMTLETMAMWLDAWEERV